jgi:ABC-2 type transport system ATP-binding protein
MLGCYHLSGKGLYIIGYSRLRVGNMVNGKEVVIEVKDLVKTYDKVNAVNGIDLKIRRGEIFAFLGPNGAGKTTTVEMIEGIRKPTKGSITILGKDIKGGSDRIKHRIGVLPQEFSSFEKVTVKETISFFSRLYKDGKKADDLIRLLRLEDHKKKLYQKLSGGLKQRVGIAVSLVNDPEIVFLDEPTTGLDPKSRQEVWSVIKGLKDSGKTVFLTTHYMEEAQELADNIAIISHGNIIAEGTVDDLIDRYGKGLILTFNGAGDRMEDFFKGVGREVKVSGSGQISMKIKNKDELLSILELLKGAGVKYRGINVRRSNLEEVFLTLTGESLKQEVSS